MRTSMMVVAAAASLAFGCVHKVTIPASNTAEAEVGVQPKSEVKLVGTFDFDILGDVTGNGCYDPHARGGYKYGTVPGVEKQGNSMYVNPAEQAKGAAIYDALTKAPGADTILVTWTKAEVQADGSACAEVHGKAVRLKKGPTPMAHEPPPHHGEGPGMGMMPPGMMPPGTPPPAPPAPAQPGVPIMPK